MGAEQSAQAAQLLRENQEPTLKDAGDAFRGIAELTLVVECGLSLGKNEYKDGQNDQEDAAHAQHPPRMGRHVLSDGRGLSHAMVLKSRMSGPQVGRLEISDPCGFCLEKQLRAIANTHRQRALEERLG